jgi:hypothetical protein
MRGGRNASGVVSRWIFPPKAKYSYEKVVLCYLNSSVPQNQPRECTRKTSVAGRKNMGVLHPDSSRIDCPFWQRIIRNH